MNEGPQLNGQAIMGLAGIVALLLTLYLYFTLPKVPEGHIETDAPISSVKYDATDFRYEVVDDDSAAYILGFSDTGKNKGIAKLNFPDKTPEGVDIVRIAPKAFENNTVITEVTNWPKKLSRIGEGAFRNTNDEGKIMKLAVWPATGTSSDHFLIGDEAFKGNDTLDDIVSPTKLPTQWAPYTDIGDEAFANFGLRKVPSSWIPVKKIGDRAFADNPLLDSVPSGWETAANGSSSVFTGTAYCTTSGC